MAKKSSGVCDPIDLIHATLECLSHISEELGTHQRYSGYAGIQVRRIAVSMEYLRLAEQALSAHYDPQEDDEENIPF